MACTFADTEGGGGLPPELGKELDSLRGELRAAVERHAEEQDQLFAAALARLHARPVESEPPPQPLEPPSAACLGSGCSGDDAGIRCVDPDLQAETATHAEGNPRSAGTLSSQRPRPADLKPECVAEQTGQQDVAQVAFVASRSARESHASHRSMSTNMDRATSSIRSAAALTIAGLGRLTRATIADRFQHTERNSESTVPRKVYWSFAAFRRIFDEAEAPKGTGFVSKLAQSTAFGIVCGLVIFLNAIFMVYTTDFQMQHPNRPATPLMRWIEVAFALFYTFEISIKLIAFRSYFFLGSDARFNIFDFVLVVTATVELSIDGAAELGSVSESGTSQMDGSFLRGLRAFKVAKALRIFRALSYFSGLKMIMNSIIGSFALLFWCFLLLLFLLYVFSILIVQSLAMDLAASGFENQEEMGKIKEYFGSVFLTIFTLMQSTTGGAEWGPIYEVLANRSGFLALLFLSYVIFFVIAAWNIVTSVFVDKAVRMAQPDLESLAWDQCMKDIQDSEELVGLMEVCSSKEGTISENQFKKLLEDTRFRSCLQVRGIAINDAELFFDMMWSLSDGDEPNIDLLVGALIRMKGNATSIDLHALSFETKLLSKAHRSFVKECRRNFESLKRDLAARSSQPP